MDLEDKQRFHSGFGIYIHWPFCKAKCPYCDFNSHVQERVDQARWRKALLKELDESAAETPGRVVTSVFFGGGTPSLMEPETVGALLDQIQKHWKVSADVEITLEANPTSVEAERFAAYRAAGVNRVSLGIQALEDKALKFLGRQHSSAEALKALEIATRHFPRFSFDLIYARPEQTVAAWEKELRQALDLAAGHLSVYQLTIEQGTPFYAQHARGDIVLPDDDTAGALYEVTQEILGCAGLPAYEVSNHAKPGQESRHNLTYWRYEDYVGIGPGAHGRVTKEGTKYATRAHRAPDIWLEKVESAKPLAAVEMTALSRGDRLTECLMMGLRLREGIPLKRLEEEGGRPFDQLFKVSDLQPLIEAGFLELTPLVLKATPAGLQRLNSVIKWVLESFI